MTSESGRRRGLNWTTSTRSQGNNACVEVAADGPLILMSDTKLHGEGPVVRFERAQWAAFVSEAVDGRSSGNGAVTVTTGPLTVEYTSGRAELTTWHVRELATSVELHYTDTEWQAFVGGAADGEFAFDTMAAPAAI